MIRRSLGVTLLGGFLTFFGGFSLLIMLLDIISWIDLYGAGSVAIVSLWGLKGFISYFLIPVLLYSAGIGVLLQRKWARRFLLFVFPFLTFFL